jgi:hypothetical protein
MAGAEVTMRSVVYVHVQLSGLGVERRETCEAAEMNQRGGDNGRGRDTVRRGELPALLSRGGINRIEISVDAAAIHRAVCHGGREGQAALRFEFPLEFTLRGIDGVEIMIQAGEVNCLARHNRSGDDGARCARRPSLLPRRGVDGVQAAPAPDVDGIAREQRRSRRARLRAETPMLFSRQGIKRIERTVRAGAIDDACRDCRCRSQRIFGFELPAFFSRRGIHGVEPVVLAAEVDDSVSQRGRSEQAPARLKLQCSFPVAASAA